MSGFADITKTLTDWNGDYRNMWFGDSKLNLNEHY